MKLKRNQKIKSLLLGGMCCVLLSCQSATPPEQLLNPEQAQTLLKQQEMVVLDVRTPEEFANGKLSGARLIDFYGAQFENEISKLDSNQKYLVYCASGNRSHKAVEIMKTKGFQHVYDLAGGIAAWQAQGGQMTP